MEGRHLPAEAVNRLVMRTLSPPELVSALRHLGECEACRERVGGAGPDDFEIVRSTIGEEAEEPAHPDLAAYAAGALSAAERELIETHLEECAECRAARPRPLARRRALLLAASIVVAILLLAVFAARHSGEPPSRPIVVAPPSHPEWDRLVREALASGRLPFPSDLDALRGEGESLRGVSGQPGERLSPAGVVIDDARPSFTWPSTADATYVVSIMEGDDEIARSEPLAAARWTPERELPRGRTYGWQVEVRRGRETVILPKPSEPLALFRIAGERDHREIAEAKRLRPADHLLHAVLYARAGLRAEALASLRAAGVTLPR